MLRAVVSRSPGAFRAVPGPQWLPSQTIRMAPRAQRWFADEKKSTDTTVLPGTLSRDTANAPPTPPSSTSPVTPSSATVIPPENVPKVPHPPPPPTQPKAAAPPSVPPTPAITNPTLPPKPKRRRFRRFILLLTTTLGLAYAGGVYYSLVSDDFHDYFTEYVPGGEEAVLFFEEREFKRRFPDGMGAATKMYPQVSGENKVTISGRSGASARVSDPKSSGAAAGGEKSDNVQKAKDAAPSPAAKGQPKAAEEKKKEPAPSTEKKPAPAPKQTEAKSSSSAPIAQIDILSLENAADPAVKKVTTILNDIISVVNADNASGKYSSALTKAKDDLKQLAAELATYKESQAQAAEAQIKKQDGEFEKAAKEMLSRVQQDQKEQELRWREEYENERARLSQTYQDKLQTELEAAQKVSEQRLHNELLQQNIKLQDSFAKTIRQQVETERDARLSKLNELSTAVSELESLTSKWNEVVDQNIKTQHLVVAVDAVRSALESTDRPTPFLHELVALKESSNNNGVVNAAIASINPVAYQRGVPTAAQLIDRFRRVAGEVRKAALLPEDAGIASHAASFVLSKVMFKKQGLAAGDDVESILTRTETLLEEGDLDEAAREMNGLTGWARVLSKDWLSDCRRVLEVKQAIEVMSTEAKLQSLLME